MEAQQPGIDTTPVLAQSLLTTARAWAILHPQATIEERIDLVAQVACELSGRRDID